MITIRVGKESDVYAINAIARQYPHELAFISKNKILGCIQQHACYVAWVEERVVGFVLFHQRRDGWATIYDLAVDRQYQGQGIGRQLVYAVPTPVQLKCKADNAWANAFYKQLGMIQSGVYTTKKGTLLYIWRLYLLPVFVYGNKASVPEVARQSTMAYGVRHDCKAYEQPFMMDVNWEKFKKNYTKEWGIYLKKVQQYQPIFALLPDIESESQLMQLDQQVKDLKALGVLRIGVCVKLNGIINQIPEELIICVSVPSRYAGFLNEDLLNELITYKRRVHLLGGGVKKILYIIERLKYQVLSIDINIAQKASVYHNYRCSLKKWVNDKERRYTSKELLVMSNLNIIKEINSILI